MHKSFSRAAEERHVSQPAFSRRIRALEDAVGVKLINRQTLPLSLTPAGEVFLSEAKIILSTYSGAIERCQAVEAAGNNVIRFASPQSLYMTHFKTRIAPMVQDGELDIDLNSTSWGADQFVSALQQGYCDVILTYWHDSMSFLSPLEVSKCEYLTLTTDEFVPVSKTGPDGRAIFELGAGGKKPIPLLSYGSASALRAVLDHILSQQINPLNVLVVNQNSLSNSVKAMILEGFGLGWLPRTLCADELADGRLTIAGGEEFQTKVQIRLYRQATSRKPTLRLLWTKLAQLSEDVG